MSQQLPHNDLPSYLCKAPPPPPLISNFNMGLLPSIPLPIGQKTCLSNSSSKDNIPYLTKKDLYNIMYDDLSRKCDILNVVCTKSKLWMQPVYPHLQDGPTCGLAIICMWADSFMEHTLTLENLLKISQANYFTKQGEMFSVANMKALCEQVMGSDHVQIQHGTQGLKVDKSFIIDEIKTGAIVFVPYDSDHNHDPCLKKGLKAHWALIFGLLEDDNGEVYLLARQGRYI
uniref:Actin maturation protease n=2 Tax=Cacopsylla melanoneura TaxID=428564 RepID=A0A8D9DXN1_9HEMI